MATSTYIPLATTTLTTSAASVTFGSIPQDYRDLVLISNFSLSASTNFQLRLNNDSSIIYNNVGAGSSGSGGLTNFSNTISAFAQNANAIDIGEKQLVQTNIFDYSATDKHTAALTTQRDTEGIRIYMFSHRYASTTAITSVQVFPLSGTINSGSTFSLYGIEA